MVPYGSSANENDESTKAIDEIDDAKGDVGLDSFVRSLMTGDGNNNLIPPFYGSLSLERFNR